MNPNEIHSFIQRLMRRELREGELSALTTRDLGNINAYLAEVAKPDLGTSNLGTPNTLVPVKPGSTTWHPLRTYSEREILLEFGVLE